MIRSGLLFCVCSLALLSMVSAYCSKDVYTRFKQATDHTCGSKANTFCSKTCHAAAYRWVSYSDGCVAPNENSLPHPFLNDNGIGKMYAPDKRHFLAQYKHVCKKTWVGAAGLNTPSIFVMLALAAAATLWTL